MPDPTDTETLAEVLAAHVRLTAMDFPFACSCDPYTQDGTRSYTAHLAEVLAARIVQARAGEGALREVRQWCREEDEYGDRCADRAEFLLWGKLFPPEALGPRCHTHAVKHTHWGMPSRPDQWAVLDLRNLTRAALTTADPS